MPSDAAIAKSVASMVMSAWRVINADSAARSAFMLYCSLLRLDDQEVEPGDGVVSVRARARAGFIVEAKGANLVEAVERFLGKV